MSTSARDTTLTAEPAEPAEPVEPAEPAGAPPVTAPAPPPVAAAPQTPPPPRRRLTRFSRIGLTLVVVLTLLESSGLTVRYLLTDHRYVISDNAQVDGTQMTINAPVDGIVTDWRLSAGSTVERNQVVGRVQIPEGSVAPKKPIRAPGAGTVARTDVTEGVYVTAGSQLATVYDQGGVYVTARVEEDAIRDVRVGAPVTVHVDASRQPLAGTVVTVGAAAAGVAELDPRGDPLDQRQPIYPGTGTDPRNPQKVDQYVPVKIDLTDPAATGVTPGMNVTVDIRRP